MTAYDDDRPGMMRVHVADARARLACQRYTGAELRAFARRVGVPVGYTAKRDVSRALAGAGHIDTEGRLKP